MKCLLILSACSLLLLVLARAEEGYKLQFVAHSAKSDVFIPLRVNKTQVFVNECGKRVTEPYGILEQTYKPGSAANGDKCTWYLHAPDNHVVNVISISFRLEDEIKPARSDDYKVSTISIYDTADEPDEKNWLDTYHVTPQEKVGHFVSSLSSKQDMVVEIKYHDNKDFATQGMLINYEFLDVDKMKELLRST